MIRLRDLTCRIKHMSDNNDDENLLEIKEKLNKYLKLAIDGKDVRIAKEMYDHLKGDYQIYVLAGLKDLADETMAALVKENPSLAVSMH